MRFAQFWGKVMVLSARSLAFEALHQVVSRGAYTDVALDRALRRADRDLSTQDRGLATELVYGCVRRQRTLDTLIEQLSHRAIAQQPPKLRVVLHLGLYQLRYLEHVPPSAAVNTSVDLAKQAGLQKLSGVVNGILRQYLRLAESGRDPLQLPNDPVARIGILHSFPDWLIDLWFHQIIHEDDIIALCEWFNQPATIDLRVNGLKTSRSRTQEALQAVGILTKPVMAAPQALRLLSSAGAIPRLPGFNDGWWTVQESSAQLVSVLLDPQPGETIIDACAAPGGKTTHIAELMQNQGRILACDRAASRLKKITANAKRLGLSIIETQQADSCEPQDWQGDRVLLDVPCSGLGTLHRHPDIRWRQTPDAIATLVQLQRQLLAQGQNWVKPGGRLVYATCTLNPDENEGVIQDFLHQHPHWAIAPLPAESPLQPWQTPEGWFYIWPQRDQMDGFFMVALELREPESLHRKEKEG